MLRSAFVVKASIIAGLYAALVIVLAPISFHAIQVRIADALLLLPFLNFFGLPSVVGLTVGCIIANIMSPFGILDVVFGAITNFIAGFIAWSIGRKSKSVIALMSTAIIQSLIIAFVIGYILLHLIYGIEPVLAFIGVLIGSIVSIGLLGSTLILFIIKRLKID